MSGKRKRYVVAIVLTKEQYAEVQAVFPDESLSEVGRQLLAAACAAKGKPFPVANNTWGGRRANQGKSKKRKQNEGIS